MIDFRGRAQLHNHPGLHDRQSIRDGERFAAVVGHVNRRQAHDLDDVAQFEDQPLAQYRVQRAERFIEHEQARIRGEAARQRDALPFTAGEPRHVAPLKAAQVDQREDFAHAALAFFHADVLHAQAEFNVLRDVQMRKQGEILKHQAEVAGMNGLIED